jgi:hypothetical protein
LALTVVVAESVSGDTYAVELAVGALPFVVYRIVAPGCAADIVTTTDPS